MMEFDNSEAMQNAVEVIKGKNVNLAKILMAAGTIMAAIGNLKGPDKWTFRIKF